VAPLLCAGITTYSPLKRYGVGKGDRVAVPARRTRPHGGEARGRAGRGGDGAQRLAAKKADAKRLGAHEFALTIKDAAALSGRFDLIVDTVSGKHDVNSVLGMLATEGTLVMVGASPSRTRSARSVDRRAALDLGLADRRIAETQEMLDFCAKHKVLADVEVMPMSGVNKAFARLAKGDVRFRFSLDLKTL